jgi:hypothetical protein
VQNTKESIDIERFGEISDGAVDGWSIRARIAADDDDRRMWSGPPRVRAREPVTIGDGHAYVQDDRVRRLLRGGHQSAASIVRSEDGVPLLLEGGSNHPHERRVVIDYEDTQ